MPDVLHQSDEETDVGAYQAYLRAQTDADLLDILLHLDPERYPARLDAAAREARRRHVLHTPVYTQAETALQSIAVAIFLLSAVTVLLTALLTPADVARPAWPADNMLPNGITALEAARIILVAVLRTIVFWSVRFGAYPLALLAMGYGLVWLLRHQGRADVRRLALIALLVLAATLLLASLPCSSVPALFDPSAGPDNFGARSVTLLNPFFASPT